MARVNASFQAAQSSAQAVADALLATDSASAAFFHVSQTPAGLQAVSQQLRESKEAAAALARHLVHAFDGLTGALRAFDEALPPGELERVRQSVSYIEYHGQGVAAKLQDVLSDGA